MSWLSKLFKGKSGPGAPVQVSAAQTQSMYGTPYVEGAGSRPGAGVSGTTGLYGGLGELPGYNEQPFQYRDIKPPAGMAPGALDAWIAAQQLAQEREATQRRNMQRRDSVLAGYDQSIANNRRMADTFDSQYAGFGESQRQALERDRIRQMGAANQSAQRRGLGNTTIRDSLGRGVQSAYQQQRTGLEDQLIQNRINLNAQALGRENQLTQNRLGFLTGIQDEGPTTEQVMGYAMQPAQIEVAKNARASQQKAASWKLAADVAKTAAAVALAPPTGGASLLPLAGGGFGGGASQNNQQAQSVGGGWSQPQYQSQSRYSLQPIPTYR